jgi:hypothetical protein
LLSFLLPTLFKEADESAEGGFGELLLHIWLCCNTHVQRAFFLYMCAVSIRRTRRRGKALVRRSCRMLEVCLQRSVFVTCVLLYCWDWEVVLVF